MGSTVVRRALLDNSAWARLLNPTPVPPERRREVASAIQAGDIFVCLPFLLEAGYSARSGLHHDELLCELTAFPHAAIDEVVEQRAMEAQEQLARRGHHRLAPSDLLIAAIADRHQLGVLHYDVLASKTDLNFESIWLTERGSI